MVSLGMQALQAMHVLAKRRIYPRGLARTLRLFIVRMFIPRNSTAVIFRVYLYTGLRNQDKW